MMITIPDHAVVHEHSSSISACYRLSTSEQVIATLLCWPLDPVIRHAWQLMADARAQHTCVQHMSTLHMPANGICVDLQYALQATTAICRCCADQSRFFASPLHELHQPKVMTRWLSKHHFVLLQHSLPTANLHQALAVTRIACVSVHTGPFSCYA